VKSGRAVFTRLTATVCLHVPQAGISMQICSKKQRVTISVLPFEVNSAHCRLSRRSEAAFA
jgi:hypothetical protein